MELRVLVDACAFSSEKGLDSAPLSRLKALRFCEHAAADPTSLTVQRLAARDSEGAPCGNGLPELAASIDEAVAALLVEVDEKPEPEILAPLVGALEAILGAAGHDIVGELGVSGALHLERAALSATVALGSARRQAESDAQRSRYHPAKSAPRRSGGVDMSEEDEKAVLAGLQSIWEVLGQPSLAEQLWPTTSWLHKDTSDEASVHLRGEIKSLREKLEAAPRPPPEPATRPMQDSVPQGIRKRMLVAFRTISGKAAAGAEDGGAVEGVKEPPSEGHQAADAGEAGGAEEPASKVPPLVAGLGKALDYMAWVLLAWGIVWLLSEEGLGLVPRLHALPPGPWQGALREYMEKRAAKVEELLARDGRSSPRPGLGDEGGGPSPGGPSLQEMPMTPNRWGLQSQYIQGPPPG